MTIKICTTGNTTVDIFKYQNFNAQCDSCFSDVGSCFDCGGATPPRYLKITLAGFGNDYCTNCINWNGTYLVAMNDAAAAAHCNNGYCCTQLFFDCPAPPGVDGVPHHLSVGFKIWRSAPLSGLPPTPPPYPYPSTYDIGYVFCTISNECSGNFTYDAFGQPLCCSTLPANQYKRKALYYWQDMGAGVVDCLNINNLTLPLQKTTTGGTPSECWAAWDSCTPGTITVSSL